MFHTAHPTNLLKDKSKLGIYDPNYKQDHVIRSNSHRTVAVFEPGAPIKDIQPFKELYIDADRCKYWLSRGAIATPAVHRLLSFAGILPPPPSNPPQGWNHKEWKNAFKSVELYVRAKTKIEES